MSTTQQTLVNIHHPMFREGYQDGRRHYFREPSILTDKQLVESLQFAFEQIVQEEAKKLEEGTYYAVGQIVGNMSGGVFPCQPHEDKTRDIQEAFLTQVRREYGAAGQALIETIRQFWELQDHFARAFDADTFERIINRGLESKGNL